MAIFFLFFLLIVHGGFSTVTRVHVHVNINHNWEDAQSYCRQNYIDLSTISSMEENDCIRAMLGASHAWIGMYRNNSNLDQFIWSDGYVNTTFTYWKPGQPDGRYKDQYCVETDGTGWADYGCQYALPFLCYSMILENEKKTWDEAIEYCRYYYTDLASLTSDDQLQQLQTNLIGESSVWVGLSFLAGQWLWLNSESVGIEVSLPECPEAPYRCGARNIQTQQWENRDCEEELSFLCF